MGVQEVSPFARTDFGIGFRRAPCPIEAVARQRIPAGGQVDSNLMRAPRDDFHLHQACLVPSLEHLHVAERPLSPRYRSMGFERHAPVRNAADGRIYRIAIPRGPA